MGSGCMESNQRKIGSKEREEKNNLIAFQKIVIDISFDFMNINQKTFDIKVQNLLEKIGNFFMVDRTYLFLLNLSNETMNYSYEWCNDGITPEIGTIEEVPLHTFSWWLDQLHTNNLVYIENVDHMSEEASVEQEQLHRQGIKSLVSVPILVEGTLQAFIGIDAVKETKKWTHENIELLHSMAKVLSSAINQLKDEKKINYLTAHDQVTGLPNRTLLKASFSKKISHTNRQGEGWSIIFVNIDGFKLMNNTLGYEQGDELLKQISRRLVAVGGKLDSVYHLGGDEFVICLDVYSDKIALESEVSRIFDYFKEPFILKSQEYFITSSMGVARYPADGEDIETLIKHANLAMDYAKNLGKNQYCIFSNELKDKELAILDLTKDLYKAIERKELVLYYQPQMSRSTGKIVGLEVLLRWNHPRWGSISPATFIPLAEKTRLIVPIGKWVLETACRQWKSWEEMGLPPCKMAVNFSVYQLEHPHIIRQIEDILEENFVPPNYLEVEVTESVLAVSNQKSKDLFIQLKKMGVLLSIDDFGKEYSSLSRLKELPVDTVKIDMSFVHDIGKSVKGESIVKAIISLVSDLGLETIAEGVETKEQLEFLTNCMCTLFQGYYFYKPMPAHEMEMILIEKSLNS